jgi:hypothetical protein
VLRLTERGYAAAEQAIGLVGRLAQLLDRASEQVDRVAMVLDQVERICLRADVAVAAVEQTRRGADEVVTRSAAVVAQAAEVSGRAGRLLTEYEPALLTLAPVVDQLARTTSAEEVAALVRLVDALPELVTRVESDVLPVLGTLGTVAPDVRDLLDTMREFNEILGSLPGLGRIKKRVEERQELQDQERADADRSQAQPVAGT